ncbi:MAG: glycosyltransferase family 4 protein, partial [Akkermansia muciniphila]
LFAGTIYELKGISYLVEAFTHPSLSHVQLFIAGNGALRERLEALSTPNIHWLGSISRAELQQHLSTAWFLVHPTLGDCCPNIVKEARVMGLPVITTEEGGQTQYVQDGVSGYIVPVHNSAAVREAAQKLSVSLDKAMSMGMERHQECRRLLDVKQTVTGCLSRYHTMLYPR